MKNNYNNLKEKAYKVALKLKKSELEEDIIYAKLEKQGFPEYIAKEVALNMLIEENNQKGKDFFDYKKWALIIVSICVLLSIITFMTTGSVLSAFEVLIYGVGSSFLVLSMTTTK